MVDKEVSLSTKVRKDKQGEKAILRAEKISKLLNTVS